MNFKKLNNIIGWIAFAVAMITYYLTLEPTVSFWDCGEYISTAYKLEVGHPPGAPLFQLIGRFFSLFASDVSQVAFMINFMSALCSAFTILFLFWTITAFGKKIVLKSSELTQSNIIAILGSGLVGALAYTFSDSFWFSAVEGEVYAMSSLFTAVTFWAILKWEAEAESKYAGRWIIFIAYLLGLSVGVHLLNLLAIPAVVFIYYFKNYKFSMQGFIVTFLLALLLTGGIQAVIIPGIVFYAGVFELFFVNSIGMPFHSGTIIYFALMIAGIVFGLYYCKKKNMNVLATGIMSFTVLLIGYSTFLALVIRSNANTPIDENNPEEAVSLLAYLNREQYGDWPILHGQYYNAQVVDLEDGDPVFKKDTLKGKYIISDNRKKSKYIYDQEFTGPFPRMWSSQQHHAKEYRKWSGQRNSKRPPKFSENIKYLFNYQIGHMYVRYFMWNFAGRQNDIQGHGEINKGNWLSGIPFVDNARLGPQENLPAKMANNKGRNTYYLLPLLLGLLGMFFHFSKNNKDAFVVLLLFLFTGLAIVAYLNQYPLQPRERDYAYVGSFYAFAIWIGIGVMAIFDFIGSFAPKKVSAFGATALCLLLVPTIMAKENWDDHDRSNRYTARDVANNYLNSCAPNAIIFTNGDNDTFPLWYAQEVEGVRTDIRVVNLSLFNTDWYIDQMKRAAYDAAPIPSSVDWNKYKQGTNDYVPICPECYEREFKRKPGRVDVKEIINWIINDNPKTKIQTTRGTSDYCPTRKLKLTVDKDSVLALGIIDSSEAHKIVDEIKWEIKGQGFAKNQLMVLDILANFAWKRPVYFAITVGNDNFMGLEDYFQLEGLAYRFVPIKTESLDGQAGIVATDEMYDNLINKFKWGNMGDPNVYLDETNMRMTMNFRNNFARLADALIKEGKLEKADSVLDRCIEVMPNDAIPYNYFNLPIADAYYRINKEQNGQQLLHSHQGNEILMTLAKNYLNELDYYNSLDQKILSSMQREYSMAAEVLNNLYRLSQDNLDTAVTNFLMNTKFSPGLNNALNHSREEALRLGHTTVSTEHLLLGILNEEEGSAAVILKKLNVNFSSLRKIIESAIQKNNKREFTSPDNIKLNQQAARAIKLTFLEYKSISKDLSTVHLLLSLLNDKNSVVERALRQFNIDYEIIQNEFYYENEIENFQAKNQLDLEAELIEFTNQDEDDKSLKNK